MSEATTRIAVPTDVQESLRALYAEFTTAYMAFCTLLEVLKQNLNIPVDEDWVLSEDGTEFIMLDWEGIGK